MGYTLHYFPDNASLAPHMLLRELAVPFELKPGEERVLRVHTCWYVPSSGLRSGRPSGGSSPAFGQSPSKGATEGQQPIAGFLGKGLVNTFDPGGRSLEAGRQQDGGGNGGQGQGLGTAFHEFLVVVCE